MKPIEGIETLDDLCKELHRIFESDHVNIEEVHSVMSSYKSNPAHWDKFAKFDRYRYTRNLVDAGNGKFNLMILCWNESQGSCIHDHSDSHCFMKVIQGELAEVQFAWPSSSEESETELRQLETNMLHLNNVAYINDSIGLHRVENRSHSEKAVSLHLYCPPYQTCHMFDQRTGHKSVCTVTFWSKYGEKVPPVEAAADN
ncbi:Cysteine dioxygenase [Chamberlinius hualienensis]